MLEKTSLFLIVLAIVILLILLWRLRRIRFNRLLIASAILALLAFELLFFLQGSTSLPNEQSPLLHQGLVTLAIILTINTIWQLIKWALLKFVARQNMKLPRFLLDFMGWLGILIISLAIVRKMLNVDLTGLLVTSTVATAVIGLSLQEILGNLFAGVILQIEAPFSVDDWVEVAGQEGKVVKQNWRTLAILTRMNNYVIFTNSNVANERLVNYSRPTMVQAQRVFIGVAYQHPPGAVKEVLAKAVSDVDGVLSMPAPQARIDEYADYAITYQVEYWLKDYAAKLSIRDAVLTRFWYALKRAGLHIPLPLVDINMTMVAEDSETQKLAQQLQEMAVVLRSLSFLQELTDLQIESLAAGAQLQHYTTGEALVKQGAEGDSLFIIKSGDVGIYIHSQDGGELRVNERTAGEFFGEMSLLTGDPRSASVIAEAETEVIVIDKKAFTEMLTADPIILELLLDALEKRSHNIERKAARAAAAWTQEQAKERANLVKRIANFLGLSLGK